MHGPTYVIFERLLLQIFVSHILAKNFRNSTKIYLGIDFVIAVTVEICLLRGSDVYSRSNSTKSPASGAGNVSELLLASPNRESKRICVPVYQGISAYRAMEVPALAYLGSSWKHITEEGGL
jgi:hypothetical protein